MIERWPLEDALSAFELVAREEALEAFRHSCLIAAVLSPWSKGLEPPEIPALLRDRDDGDDS